MSDEEICVCPYCGKSWKKDEKAHRKYLDVAMKTAVTLVTTTLMVILLKALGL